jgi:hypothetical protein
MHWVAEDGTILWAKPPSCDCWATLATSMSAQHRGLSCDRVVIADILNASKNNEALKGYEARLRLKNGTIRDVSINSNVYREERTIRPYPLHYAGH